MCCTPRRSAGAPYSLTPRHFPFPLAVLACTMEHMVPRRQFPSLQPLSSSLIASPREQPQTQLAVPKIAQRRPNTKVKLNIMDKWNSSVAALNLPSSVRDLRRKYGMPPEPREKTCPEVYMQTAEENELISDEWSVHQGPLSPASQTYRQRFLNEKELSLKDRWINKLDKDNQVLEQVVADCFAMNAQGHLDAFAHAIESHVHRDDTSGASLRKSGKTKPKKPLRVTFKGEPAGGVPSKNLMFDDSASHASDLASSSGSFMGISRMLPKKAVPVLRFPSAMNAEPSVQALTPTEPAVKSQPAKKASKRPAIPATKVDYGQLLREQAAHDQVNQQRDAQYRKMMADFEMSQRTSNRIMELYVNQGIDHNVEIDHAASAPDVWADSTSESTHSPTTAGTLGH